MADNIRVNNNGYSWGSIVAKLDGERYHGFTAISYGDKREREIGHGMGPHNAPRSRSRGKYSVEPVKLSGPPDSVQALRNALAAKSGDGKSYGDVEFQIVVQYFESELQPLTVEIDRCVYVSSTVSNDAGSDLLSEDVEISAMKIRRNGQRLYDASGGEP